MKQSEKTNWKEQFSMKEKWEKKNDFYKVLEQVILV